MLNLKNPCVMFDLFIAGGPGAMSLLSPAWVREIGLLALVTGCFWQFAGLFQAAGVVAEVGEWPSVGLLLNGFKVSLIPVMYGMMIYALSLVIRLVQKPRI